MKNVSKTGKIITLRATGEGKEGLRESAGCSIHKYLVKKRVFKSFSKKQRQKCIKAAFYESVMSFRTVI